MFLDTALMRLVVAELAERQHWSYEETLEKFYNSGTCDGLSDRETGMFTFAPIEIIERFEEEMSL
jgi:hypothetical protein